MHRAAHLSSLHSRLGAEWNIDEVYRFTSGPARKTDHDLQRSHPDFDAFHIRCRIAHRNRVAYAFLRKSSIRHPMDGQPERNIEDIRMKGGNI